MAAAVALSTVAVLSVPVLAQTAGQITPPSFRPPVESGPETITVPQAVGPEAPPGADRLTVRVGPIIVDGTLPPLAAETRRITGPLEGTTTSVAALFAAARDLEQAYVRAGYVLARVVLPAQSLTNGAPVHLTVIDGFIESIDTSKLAPQIRARVDAVLAPLVGMRGIRLERIERQLLLAGDTPGAVLRSTLAPGSTTGAGMLVIEARYQMVTGFLSFDNTLAADLGRYTAGLGLNVNSALGFGEQFYLRASGYPDDGSTGFVSSNPRNRSLAAGVVVPLGRDGVTFNAEFTDARTTPVGADDLLAFTSDFNRWSARLRYPLIRSREMTLATELDFDAEEERLTALAPIAAPLALDRLRVFRPLVDGAVTLPWEATLTGRLMASFGVNGLGARPPSDVTAAQPFTRQDARPDFQKIELTVGYSHPILPSLVADLQAHGQSSFGQALPLSEQIGLAVPNGLSSFDAGLFQGDSGYVVRGELQAPYPVAIQGGTLAVAPYLFGAYGQAFLSRPTVLELGTSSGASYGVGLRTGGAKDASFLGGTFGLEYGRRDRSNGGGSGDRVTVTALFNF